MDSKKTQKMMAKMAEISLASAKKDSRHMLILVPRATLLKKRQTSMVKKLCLPTNQLQLQQFSVTKIN